MTDTTISTSSYDVMREAMRTLKQIDELDPRARRFVINVLAAEPSDSFPLDPFADPGAWTLHGLTSVHLLRVANITQHSAIETHDAAPPTWEISDDDRAFVPAEWVVELNRASGRDHAEYDLDWDS